MFEMKDEMVEYLQRIGFKDVVLNIEKVTS